MHRAGTKPVSRNRSKYPKEADSEDVNRITRSLSGDVCTQRRKKRRNNKKETLSYPASSRAREPAPTWRKTRRTTTPFRDGSISDYIGVRPSPIFRTMQDAGMFTSVALNRCIADELRSICLCIAFATIVPWDLVNPRYTSSIGVVSGSLRGEILFIHIQPTLVSISFQFSPPFRFLYNKNVISRPTIGNIPIPP